jgi:hypothetical protein
LVLVPVERGYYISWLEYYFNHFQKRNEMGEQTHEKKEHSQFFLP